jgi:hypothetical protein
MAWIFDDDDDDARTGQLAPELDNMRRVERTTDNFLFIIAFGAVLLRANSFDGEMNGDLGR